MMLDCLSPHLTFSHTHRHTVFTFSVCVSPQGYEDWLRHKADYEVNKYLVTVLEDGRSVKKDSEKIKVPFSCCTLANPRQVSHTSGALGAGCGKLPYFMWTKYAH